jgi:pathogenesis-related protein 1
MRGIIVFKNLLLVAMSAALVNTAYAFDAAQQTEMVTAHNKLRQTVGAPPLAWSAGLATTAQAWADTLKATQGCKPVHSGTAGVGENIFWAGATTQTSTSSTGVNTTTSTPQAVTAAQATDYWASEGKDYTYSTNTCAAGKVCSHYTQVVWKTTTDIGCGNAVCADNTQVWVCQYTPPGNYVGQKPY